VVREETETLSEIGNLGVSIIFWGAAVFVCLRKCYFCSLKIIIILLSFPFGINYTRNTALMRWTVLSECLEGAIFHMW
jgi:hypothetical protein